MHARCKKMIVWFLLSYTIASVIFSWDLLKSPFILFTGPIMFLNSKLFPAEDLRTCTAVNNASFLHHVSWEDFAGSEGSILKYQKCKYPKIDPFDPATMSYHNKPVKFTCSMKRVGIVRNQILRVDVENIKYAWLHYILRISDSVSDLSPKVQLLENEKLPVDSDEMIYRVKCLKHCPDQCGPKKYCCVCDHFNCSTDITKEIQAGEYRCTKRPRQYIFYRVKQEFLKLSLIDKGGGSWGEYHHAFLKPPNSENSVNDRLNIIMLHLDGASDANVQRQLKKTYKYLKNHDHTVIFKKHSVIGDGTTENMCGFLTGHLITELPEGRKSMKKGRVVDKWPFIWKDMHKKNYETWFVEEYGPLGGTFHYRLRGFKNPPVKHYYRPLWMFLDPIMGKHPMCGAKFHFENMKQYYNTYRNFNKYSLVMLHYLSHDYPSWLSNVDNLILDFYHHLEKEGHMNNTVFIMYGDHGNRASSFRGTFQGKLEERNPYLSITVPPWFEKYKKLMRNLRWNKDVLTTHFDSYSTLQHLLTFPHENNKTRTAKGASYFSTDFRMLNRTCAQVFIKPHYCLCLNTFKSVDLRDPAVCQVVWNVISFINEENEKYANGLCHILSLKYFVRAFKQQGLRNVTNYKVKFVTSPNNGLYEATIPCEGDRNEFRTCAAPEISRTNLYGSQPECIRNIAPRLAKYCYCKNYKGKPSELEVNL